MDFKDLAIIGIGAGLIYWLTRETEATEILEEIFIPDDIPEMSIQLLFPEQGGIRIPNDDALFGAARYENGQIHHRHTGLDFNPLETTRGEEAAGTPIYAPFSGKLFRTACASGYGHRAILSHPNRQLDFVFGHLEDANNGISDIILTPDNPHQVIGYIGQSGATNAPHVHLEVYRNNQRIDPLDCPTFLEAAGEIIFE